MKATVSFPAHTSYFRGHSYTQQEVDEGIATLFRLCGGKPFGLANVTAEVKLLREPGQQEGVILDSADYAPPNTPEVGRKYNIKMIEQLLTDQFKGQCRNLIHIMRTSHLGGNIDL